MLNEKYYEISMENMDPIRVSDINSQPIASTNVNAIKLKLDQSNFATSIIFQIITDQEWVFKQTKQIVYFLKFFQRRIKNNRNNKTNGATLSATSPSGGTEITLHRQSREQDIYSYDERTMKTFGFITSAKHFQQQLYLE